MENNLSKEEIGKLYDQVGNSPDRKTPTRSNIINWLNKDNQQNPTINKEKKPCKTCGDNRKTTIVLVVIGLIMMLAGHGLFTLLSKLF